MSAVSKAMYMPLQIATSVAGGLLAGRIFTEIWQRISPSDREPPDPKDLDRSGTEAITAAAIQGSGVRTRPRRRQPRRCARLSRRHPREPGVIAFGIMA